MNTKLGSKVLTGVEDIGKFIYKSHDKDGIVIKLGAVCVINHIKMKILSKSNTYFIEVSVDNKHWHRIVDRTQFKCRSLQNLYFPCRTVRYIRLVGNISLGVSYALKKLLQFDIMFYSRLLIGGSGLIVRPGVYSEISEIFKFIT